MRGLFVIALFLGVICLCSDGSHASTRESYKENGITITGSKTWKPYTFLDAKGEPSGFFIDFWRKWSEKTGVPVHFRLVTWDESIRLVASGEADLHSGLYYTEKRAKTFGYSKPIFYSKGVVVVRSDVSCESGLANRKWGGVVGTEELRFAKERANGEVTSFTNSVQLLTALAGGDVDAVVDDWSSAVMLGNDLGIATSLVICEDVYQEDLQAIVLKENKILLSLVDEGILQISKAEHRVIVNRWYVDQRKGGGHFNYMATAAAAVFVLLIGALIGRRVRKTT